MTTTPKVTAEFLGDYAHVQLHHNGKSYRLALIKDDDERLPAVKALAEFTSHPHGAGAGVTEALFDVCPNLGHGTEEPSLSDMVHSYYVEHFGHPRADALTRQYLAALAQPAAELRPS